MKHRPIALRLTALLLAGLPLAALAGSPVQGVRCPLGVEAEIGPGNKSLKCSKNEEVRREVICSPAGFKRSGEIKLSAAVVRKEGGAQPDQCVIGTLGEPANSFLPLPGDPPSTDPAWQRRTVPGGVDYYFIVKKAYVFPEEGPLYNPLHNPANGVSCPAGYDGDRKFDGRGIRCDKVEATRSANCDFGWSISQDHNNGIVDKCLGLNVGPTVPDGVPKLLFDQQQASERISWSLNEKRGRDDWQKKVYEYPQSR